MSVAEKTLKNIADTSSVATVRKTAAANQPIVNRILNFLSSVSFGVSLLIILVVLSMLGMVIIQQNVNGFDAYFAGLTPAEKTVYGFLGFFDVYHSWYYNALLLVLSLNIVLASIDHFPASWKYIANPKLGMTRGWLLNQKQNAVVRIEGATKEEVAEKISRVFKENGLKAKIGESEYLSYALDAQGNKNFSEIIKKQNLYVFGERGVWNRLGAYVVHVALLLLFLGHFTALQTGFDADVRLSPGQTTEQIEMIEFNLDQTQRYSVALPFTITCTDIQQTLIDQKGSIEVHNTLDWRTQIKIDDPEYGTTVADVQLNKPYSYRGYRFFQASAITVGSARNMTLEVTPQNGGETFKVNLLRNGSAELPDGSQINYSGFFPDFTLVGGKPDTRSGDYNNPAVKFNLVSPQGETKAGYAFAAVLPDNAPVGAAIGGYKFRLADYEKSPFAHVLSIKYDPFQGAFIAWYFGGVGLIFALFFVFFISHQRVWAAIEKKPIGEGFEVTVGGHTNRNHYGFEQRFQKIVAQLEAQNRI